jgi:hypothetical protein
MSNSTLLRADRTTHLKIVATSLIAGILVVSIGIAARLPITDGMARIKAKEPVLKAGQPVALMSRPTATIR